MTLNTEDEEHLAFINRRQRQVLVHSCIYYHFNQNIISDHDYDRWCYEIVGFREQLPHIFEQSVYKDAYENFDGSTGFDLPFKDHDVVDKAIRLLHYHKVHILKQ